MASAKAVSLALAVLGEAFPTREVTENTPRVWAAIFAEVSDELLDRASMLVARDPSRRFFPTTGELFAALASMAPVVDSGAVLRRISSLGNYTPGSGWVYPGVERVREALGDPIANAYAAAGGERCFAGDDGPGAVTQDIARRAFAEEVNTAQRLSPSRPLLAPAPPSAARLNSGVQL